MSNYMAINVEKKEEKCFISIITLKNWTIKTDQGIVP